MAFRHFLEKAKWRNDAFRHKFLMLFFMFWARRDHLST